MIRDRKMYVRHASVCLWAGMQTLILPEAFPVGRGFAKLAISFERRRNA